jgi:MFS transporter, DHA1 family, tetracycline resistance protein
MTPHPPVGNRRALFLALSVVFLDIMGLGLIVPVLPFYARDFGADSLQIGLLFTAFAALNFLTTPVLGALSDRYGRRPVLLLSLAGEVVGYTIMAFATNLPLLYLSRAVAGATAGNIGAARAYLADISTPEDRTRTFGLFGATFSVGFLFGPAMGGILSQIDVRAPAIGAAILIGLNLLFAAIWLPESLPPELRSKSTRLSQLNPLWVLLGLLGRPRLRGPLIGSFLLAFGFSGLQTNLPIFANDRFGFGPTDVAQLFVALAVTGIVTQALLVPRLSRRFSDEPILLAGLAVLTLSFLTTGFAPSRTVLFIGLPLLAAGNALAQAPLAAVVSKLVGPTEQGLVSGGSQGIMSLAAIFGPIWAGFAYDRFGQSSPYLSGAVLIVAAMASIAIGVLPARRAAASAP